MDSLDFLVRRDDLRACRFDQTPLPELAAGQVLLAVDRFGLSANNITYAVFGERMRYWNFFPAPEGYGRVPAWGFGDVVASRHEGLAPGARVYGYFPMSSHLIVQADRVGPAGFVDASEHRRGLPAVYNQYTLTTGDPGYDPRFEDAQMLLRPLFLTSFLLDDFLADEGFFGAEAVVIASASSKTAIGLAFLLAGRTPRSVELIGLTSAKNRGFVEGLGCYDRVLPYGEVTALPPGRPTVFVDMAGDAEVRAAVHGHFGALRHSCVVGATHWDRAGSARELPGPPPTFFFAPDRAQRRIKEWGMAGLLGRFGAEWLRFMDPVSRWMRVRRGQGREALQWVYLDTLAGRADPAEGHVLSLREA